MKVDFRSAAMMTSLTTSVVLSPSLLLLLLLAPPMSSYSAHELVTSPQSDLGAVADVTFIHNVRPGVCGDPWRRRVVAVVVVCSAVENQLQRDVIRRTWADLSASTRDEQLRVVFLLGRVSTDNNTIRSSYDEAVAAESRRHGDIIQADFVDTYANLSRKSLAVLRWAAVHGTCARFIVKCDDDAFVNTRLLAADLSACAHRRFVMGHVIARARPVRDPTEKWYTPESVFRAPAYPTYASGAAYVISGDAVGPLLRAAEAGSQPLFWIEDVYVTGILAKMAGVQLIVNGKFDGYRPLTDVCALRNHIVQHRVSEQEMDRMWREVTSPEPPQCRQDTDGGV